MDSKFAKVKWIKYSVSYDIYKKFLDKAMSDGYSLYAASRLLAELYVNGKFDLTEKNQ